MSIAASDGTDSQRKIQSLVNLATVLGVDLETADNAQLATDVDAAVADLESTIAEIVDP